ncbi:MAG: lipocalin-like domain-containing protein [Bacteroides sp.]|nr:lipocalin-like domain-containing protein [Bacteroides sp.]
MMTILSGCTHNNGDIGDFFGEWRVEKITADGQPIRLYEDLPDSPILYTWAFQGNIIRINTLLSHNRFYDCFGTWSDVDEILTLRFTYTDSDDGDGYRFTPPEVMHLSADGVTHLQIDHLDGKKMELSRTDSDGILYRYYLTHPH